LIEGHFRIDEIIYQIYSYLVAFNFIYRRRRSGFSGFHLESLEKNPDDPVNPVTTNLK
jgi:hypothetical protein